MNYIWIYHVHRHHLARRLPAMSCVKLASGPQQNTASISGAPWILPVFHVLTDGQTQ